MSPFNYILFENREGRIDLNVFKREKKNNKENNFNCIRQSRREGTWKDILFESKRHNMKA